MPGSFESGLRLVEHYNGRADATKQDRGVFPQLVQSPDINPGRVIRDRSGIITGTAAQPASSLSTHGTRPEASFRMEGRPEDLLLALMAFFHNRKYTVISQGPQDTAGDYIADYRETGTFEYGAVDARPDHEGAIVGTYDPSAASYKELVAMSDAYSIGLEYLFGHGDLGDVDNGLSIDNFVANRVLLEVTRGIDQYLEVEFGGFGRVGDEVPDFAEASWGPGVNGELSDQAVLTPDTATFSVFELNDSSVLTKFDDWIDALSIEMVSGFAGRDALGHDEFNALSIDGRPMVTGTIQLAHVAPDFLTALKNGHKFEITVKFSNGANEYVELTLPHLLINENFSPDVGDPGSDITTTVPFKGVIDPDVTNPLVEVEVATEFDVRTNSYFRDTTLAASPTYTDEV